MNTHLLGELLLLLLQPVGHVLDAPLELLGPVVGVGPHVAHLGGHRRHLGLLLLQLLLHLLQGRLPVSLTLCPSFTELGIKGNIDIFIFIIFY